MLEDERLEQPISPFSLLLKGAIAALPLSIAVIPWGVLAGSYAIDAGMNAWEAQAMSAILFAGSAQLVISGMFKAGIGIGTMVLTTFFITSRHLLYSVAMREKISHLPWYWRVLLGHWLTDELFAICSGQTNKTFTRWFAAGVGGSFYLIWNLSSFAGIWAGSYFPDLQSWGLDFAVAATFIAIVVPHIKTTPVIMSVLVSGVSIVFFTLMAVPGTLMLASLLGMITGYWCETRMGSQRPMLNQESR